VQSHPTKNRLPAAEKKHTHVAAKAGDALKRQPFSAFLIEIDFKHLAFVGRCGQCFGFGAASAEEGLAHGFLASKDMPVTEKFEIGVLTSRLGPLERDGSFSIQVPESDHYLITVWNRGYQKLQLIELKPDSVGDIHKVPFFPGMAVESPMNNRSGSPNGYASLKGKAVSHSRWRM